MTVQLIRDNSGIDWYIEINRFGGGAPLSRRLVRSAEAILRLMDGQKVPYPKISQMEPYTAASTSLCVSKRKRSD